jgi:hypothetical protein
LYTSEATLAFEESLFHGVGRRFYGVVSPCANDEALSTVKPSESGIRLPAQYAVYSASAF